MDILFDVVNSVGLDAKEARRVLAESLFVEEVDSDWEKSRTYGVTGVPTFVAGGYGVVGAQPYEALEKLMKQAGADELDNNK